MLHESKLVVGYTTQDHLLVDLDDCSFFKAARIAKIIGRTWPDVGDCLVVESSPSHFHLIYDDIMEWEQIVRIIDTLAKLNIVEKNYRDVRNFRRDLTLRVSEKRAVDGVRQSPRLRALLKLEHNCNEGDRILEYMCILTTFI